MAQEDIYHDYFENIDNEEKAYWFGFLCADGCVSVEPNGTKSIIFGLHSDDEAHVYKFLECINASHKKVYSRLPRQKFSYTQIYSKKMADDLARHGCIPHKSLHLQFPTDIHPFYVRDFVRGYFDGDGSVYKIRGSACCKFIGTHPFLTSMRSYLLSQGCSDRPVEHTYAGEIWHLRFQRKSDIKTIYTLLYNESKIYLARKKKKFGFDIQVQSGLGV